MELDEHQFSTSWRQALARGGAWQEICRTTVGLMLAGQPKAGGTATAGSIASLVEDALAEAGCTRTSEIMPVVRASLVRLQQETAHECAAISDRIDDLSGVSQEIRQRFRLPG